MKKKTKKKAKKEVWCIDIIESEEGWGQKVESTYEFKTFTDAKKFEAKYNKQHTAKEVPVCYAYAGEPYLK